MYSGDQFRKYVLIYCIASVIGLSGVVLANKSRIGAVIKAALQVDTSTSTAQMATGKRKDQASLATKPSKQLPL